VGTSSLGHTAPSPVEHHVEVHAVDSDRGVVLDAQVDVLLDSEAEVAGVREVLAVELILLDLKIGAV